MPLADGDTVRFVTNDFMYTGGDGYTVFTQGTDVLQKGDLLLDVVAAYIEANRAGRAGRGGSDHRPVVRLIRTALRTRAGLGPALFMPFGRQRCLARTGNCAVTARLAHHTAALRIRS